MYGVGLYRDGSSYGVIWYTGDTYQTGSSTYEGWFNIDRMAFTSESVSVVGRGHVGFDGDLSLILKPRSGPLLGIDFFVLRWAGDLLSFLLDSVANVDELSLSGRLASETADLCLTQWPQLAGGRVKYVGAVL